MRNNRPHCEKTVLISLKQPLFRHTQRGDILYMGGLNKETRNHGALNR